MAGPLSGIGQGQQIPLNNTFQSGQISDNQQVRPQNEDEQEAQTNQVQPRSTEAAQTQNTETGNQEDILASLREESLNTQSAEPRERGSLIDITV